MANREEIFEVIKDHLNARGVEVESLKPESDLMGDVGLDSLDVTELTLGLEEHFGIEIPDEDLEGVRTVGDAVDLVEQKVAVGT